MRHTLALTIALILVVLAAVAVSWMRWHRLGPFRPPISHTASPETAAKISAAVHMYLEQWAPEVEREGR